MFASDKPNPFEVLGLPVEATVAAITKRGEALVQTAASDEQRRLYHWAIAELTTRSSTRLRYELYEPPDTQYQAEREAWNSFARKHKINSVKRSALAKETPALSLEDFNLEALLGLLLEGFLAVPPTDIIPAIKASPFAREAIAPPLEVRDVIFG
ncbi:MAG TPA: hypothetical protein VKR06_12885 [Ktedonosporobacter sp.]|nr:hypothetical protein [Ktedonosporobacter sp.]